MFQKWRDLTFLHFTAEPSAVQQLLPDPQVPSEAAPPNATKSANKIAVSVVTGPNVRTPLLGGQLIVGGSMSTVHVKVTWHVADELPLASLAVTSKTCFEPAPPVTVTRAPKP